MFVLASSLCLPGVECFNSFSAAKNRNLFSKSAWRKQGIIVPAGGAPSGIVIRQSCRMKVDPLPWQPVVKSENGVFTVASDYYEVYSNEVCKCVDNNTWENSDNKNRPSPSPSVSSCSKEFLPSNSPHYDEVLELIREAPRTYARTRMKRTIISKEYVPEGLDLPKDELFRDDILRFVSLIYRRRILGHVSRDEFIPLKREYLNNTFGNRFGAIWSRVEKRIVERDDHYVMGAKSYGYRLAEPYRSQIHRLRDVERPKVRVVDKAHCDPVVKFLAQSLDAISVDEAAFSRFSEWKNYELFAELLQFVRDRQWNVSVDQFGSRFHSVLTRLYKPLRSVLRFGGQHPVEIDVRNSQPLFLAAELIRRGVTCEEYRQAVESGALYDSLAAPLEMARDEAKTELLKVFYSKNGYSSPLKRLFTERFPGVAGYIKKVKASDHKRLSRIMQQAESKLILHRVCRRIMDDSREIPIATIHDSVLTTPGNAEFVKELMREEFQKIGVTPQLRSTAFDELWTTELFAQRERVLKIYAADGH